MSDVINSVINMGNEVINSVVSHMAGSFMSIFILGIVTGWLIEWLFYYFIWKKCSPKKCSPKKSVEKSQAPIIADETAKPAGIETKQQPKKQQPVNELTNDAVPEKLESTKDSNATVQDDDVDMLQDVKVKKTSKENRLTEKDAPIKEDTVISEASSEKVLQADDFTTIVGIGPRISKYLNDIEVDSFKKLSALTREELIEKLNEKGVQLSNKEIMASWADQAKLADAGDVDGLVAFQNKLKNG